MIVDVQGAAGTVVQSIPISALTTNSTVKLKYFHFPDLPLLDEFDEALTVNSEKFTVPASSSIEDIVNASCKEVTAYVMFGTTATNLKYAWVHKLSRSPPRSPPP